jgi:hypothetical protein
LNRLIDRGAVFAGWVGLGMALVVAIAFELIVAVQSIVFVAAPLIGLIIGIYANIRSERRRPRWRVLANSAWAGIVTGVGLAVIYVVLRLVFLYGDTGVLISGEALECRTGPECTYMRYVEAGRADDLAQVGVTDAATYEAAALREQFFGGLTLIGLTMAGSMAGGVARSLGAASSRPEDETEPAAPPEGKRRPVNS